MGEWKKEFISMWSDPSSKDLKIREAHIFKDKYLPNSIFKYREFNDYSITNLKNDAIWLSNPNDFNDPYDSGFSVNPESFFTETLKIKRPLGFKIGSSNKVLESLISKFSFTGNDPIKDKRFADFLKQMFMEPFNTLNLAVKNDFRICSFSETKDNILMWTHYTKDHSGFCIEYDLSKLHQENPRRWSLYPVIYLDAIFDSTQYILAANRNRKSFNNIFPYIASLHKSKEWSYEKEWRLIFSHINLNEYHMPVPKALYLGSKINNENKEQLLNIAAEKAIDVYQMKLMDTEYKLYPEKIK